MRYKLTILMLGLIFTISGCSTYRLVEVDVNTTLQTESEITAVKNIDLRLAEARNVVISYSSEYYDNNEKSAKNSKVLMGGKGMWITEIEREFVKRGFRILSRQKYNELIREKGVEASKEAATLLGADLIIQINSLEYSDRENLIGRTVKTFTVFDSDSSGAKLKRSPRNRENNLAENQAQLLAHRDVGTGAYMALLDCKIIDAKTGELILFYRNQEYRLKSSRKSSGTLTYLFKLDDDKWELVDSKLLADDTHGNKIHKGISRSHATNIKIQMVRRVCADLVNRIKEYRRQGKNQVTY